MSTSGIIIGLILMHVGMALLCLAAWRFDPILGIACCGVALWFVGRAIAHTFDED